MGFDNDSSSHLVRWEEVIKPKHKGGLEIGNLIIRNRSLLLKWLWRFTREGEMLWHKVIRSKHGRTEGGWWSYGAGSTMYRSPWKAIQGLLSVFLNHAKLKLGNGERIRFWEDAWGEREPFKDKYPNHFRLSLLHNRPVIDFLDNPINLEPSWNLHLRRSVSEREVAELAGLLSTLERVRACGVLDNK